MSRTRWVIGSALVVLACGGPKPAAEQPEAVASGQRSEELGRCEYKGREDRDVQETSAPGTVLANVRRVYGYIGTGTDRRRILLCREVDTNFDGVKDIVRTFGDNGEKLSEQADADYDGRIDTWITFGTAGPAKIETDETGDGKPDEARFYVATLLARVQRDTNADGTPDIFEIYAGGRLERMGVDANFDGQVDVWHRDDSMVEEEEVKGADAPENDAAADDSKPKKDAESQVGASN